MGVEGNIIDGDRSSRFLLVCAANGTQCREVDYPKFNPLTHGLLDVFMNYREPFTRTKRAWSSGKEPICKLKCDCSPDFETAVNQAGTVEQVAKQEQIWGLRICTSGDTSGIRSLKSIITLQLTKVVNFALVKLRF